MEQYVLKKEHNYKNLKTIIDNYEPLHLFIRYIGSSGDHIIINQDLEKNDLFVYKNAHKDIFFNLFDKKVFVYHNDSHRFSLAYRRLQDDGKLLFLSGGLVNPYNSRYNEPFESVLRGVDDNLLLEISVKGRVNIKPLTVNVNDYTPTYKIIKE
jgi:hypothetical protein